MEKQQKERSMVSILLIVVGVTLIGVLAAVGVQLLLFGKTVVSVTSAVGVVCGVTTAAQLSRKAKAE